METFGDRLRYLLDQNEYSQKEFASKIDVSPTAVNNYVQNQRFPRFHELIKICSELHCSADYLLGIKEAPILRLTDEESELLKAWRKTDDRYLKDLIKHNLGILEGKRRAL